MNKKVLHTLEYDKIISQLSEFATCPGGERLCHELVPISDFSQIRVLQTQTSDALTRILRLGSLSFSGTRDILESVKRLEIGSSLSIKELLKISSVLKVSPRFTSNGTAVSAGSSGCRPFSMRSPPLETSWG